MGIGSRSRWPARFGGFVLSRCADRAIAQCEAEYPRLERAGIARDMMRAAPAPVDCEGFLQRRGDRQATRDAFLRRYGLPRSARLMGYFAAFRPNKRHAFLIAVFNSLAERFPDWALVLGGDGVERVRCQQLVEQLGLSQRVILPGKLHFDVLAPLLAAMDAVVHCSASESFGKSMVEPLIFGVPTVVTRVGIGYELERDGKALVVTPDSVVELQDALQRLMRGDPAVERMAKGTLDYVLARFDISTVVHQLVKIYEGG
jgi:glycosyltransferase involved in cell wall biosynthesis